VNPLGDSQTKFTAALAKHPGLASFGVGREVKALGTLLRPNEQLLDIIQGQYATQTGVLLHTSARVIFFAKGIVTTVVEEFPLEKIVSIQYSTGIMLGDLTIFASGNKAEIKNTVKAHTKSFADALREHLDRPKQPSPLTTATTSVRAIASGSAGVALMDELTKLSALKTNGLLTDEEFTAAKRKLLGI
jgi:hypothetical protein